MAKIFKADKPVIFAALFIIVCANQVTASSGKPPSSSESGSGEEETSCEDEFSPQFCQSIAGSKLCPGASEESPLKNGCKKTCGFCEAESGGEQNQNEGGGGANTKALNDEGGCEDKIPNCSSYLSMCCSMKDAMNSSCPKTCKFCSESPSTPEGPGGIAAPTAATDQDPCEPGAPSVTVDTPGQTTTTQAPITAGTFPGISIDGSLPGQSTTTTQSSITMPPVG